MAVGDRLEAQRAGQRAPPQTPASCFHPCLCFSSPEMTGASGSSLHAQGGESSLTPTLALPWSRCHGLLACPHPSLIQRSPTSPFLHPLTSLPSHSLTPTLPLMAGAGKGRSLVIDPRGHPRRGRSFPRKAQAGQRESTFWGTSRSRDGDSCSTFSGPAPPPPTLLAASS